MMGRRLPATSGAELDAITSWRHLLAWNHVRRSYWKRTLRRRERKQAKRKTQLLMGKQT